MSGISGECNTSEDCLDLTPTGVFKFCYETASFSNETNFCECSNWYGWIGENCDEKSFGLYFFNISSWFILLWSTVLVILSGRTGILNILLGNSPTGVDPIFYTGFFVFLTGSFLSIMAILNIIATSNPMFFRLVDYKEVIFTDQGEEVIGIGGDIALYCALLSSLCFLFSSLTIILSWNRVLERVGRFNSPRAKYELKVWSKIVKFTISIFTVVFIGILSPGFVAFAGILLFFALIGISIAFIGFGNLFVRNLNIYNEGSEALQLTIKMVKNTYVLYTITLIMMFVTLLLYYVFVFDYEEVAQLGGFNYAQFPRDLLALLLLFISTYVAWYVNAATEGILIVNENSLCARLFYYWDLQNIRRLEASVTSNPVSKSFNSSALYSTAL